VSVASEAAEQGTGAAVIVVQEAAAKDASAAQNRSSSARLPKNKGVSLLKNCADRSWPSRQIFRRHSPFVTGTISSGIATAVKRNNGRGSGGKPTGAKQIVASLILFMPINPIRLCVRTYKETYHDREVSENM
jgi:hypothetical protein